MITFVFSGAGNRGPLQVGAVQALLAHGIKPDLLVGTSAGAINSVVIAAYGVDDPKITEHMAALWAEARAAKIYPGNIFQIGWRILNKEESIFPNTGVRDFSKTMAMVERGKALTEAYLLAPRPRTLAPAGVESSFGETVGAAQEYIPPQQR